jgi:hypothetical protein
LYRSSNTVRMIRSRGFKWAGHVARIIEERSAFKILTGKRPIGRPRYRWEDNVRMDLTVREIGVNVRDWVDSAQDRDYWRALVNVVLSVLVHNP